MPQIGDTFVIQYEIVRPADTQFEYKGQFITNYFCNLFWARMTNGNSAGEEILVCFDRDFDPFVMALKEINRGGKQIGVDSSPIQSL